MVAAAALDARRRQMMYGRAVAFGVANTQCSSERECQFGALRLLTLATLRLPDVALYGELLHCHAAEQRACCRLVARTLIGASSGAMRLAHRALEMHALELGYRAHAWVQRAVDGAGDELSASTETEEHLPVALEQARLAAGADAGDRVDGGRADGRAGPDRQRAWPSARDLPDRHGGRIRGMTELLRAGLRRLAPRGRRVLVAVGALLALGAVMVALTLTNQHGGHNRRWPEQRPTAAGSPRPAPSRLPPLVSTAAMLQARRVAARFLAGYLPFAYGRGGALAIPDVTPALRRELLRQRAQLTPVERRRRPRVVALQTVGTTPAFVVATAVIDDGGVTTYRLRFMLQRQAGRWAVTSLADG